MVSRHRKWLDDNAVPRIGTMKRSETVAEEPESISDLVAAAPEPQEPEQLDGENHRRNFADMDWGKIAFQDS